jgi:hypothetical protein
MTGQQKHIANAQQSYTLASRTSQRTDQSFVKECVCPTARPKRPTNQRTKKSNEPPIE